MNREKKLSDGEEAMPPLRMESARVCSTVVAKGQNLGAPTQGTVEGWLGAGRCGLHGSWTGERVLAELGASLVWGGLRLSWGSPGGEVGVKLIWGSTRGSSGLS